MRLWVSTKSLTMGYGRYPFEVHDRKREATILECKDNKVTYAYKTNMDEHLCDNIATVPIEAFTKAYEPMQESIKFVCYRRGKHWDVDHTEPNDLEKREILSRITKTRIIG